MVACPAWPALTRVPHIYNRSCRPLLLTPSSSSQCLPGPLQWIFNKWLTSRGGNCRDVWHVWARVGREMGVGESTFPSSSPAPPLPLQLGNTMGDLFGVRFRVSTAAAAVRGTVVSALNERSCFGHTKIAFKNNNNVQLSSLPLPPSPNLPTPPAAAASFSGELQAICS